MDTAELVRKIKLRPGMENASDELITDLVDDAQRFVIDYIHDTQAPEGLTGVIKDMAVIKYNRLGDEGLTGVSRAGINQSYLDDIPAGLIKQLNHYRKLPIGRW